MSGPLPTSIIIPTYNGLHLLARCLDSIRKFTEVPYEIIVVDNGSTDGTAEYCERQKVRLIALPQNEGFPKAANKGLAIASGEQMLLLNNDCVVTPRWLSQMLTALHSSEHTGIVGPVTNYASGRQQIETGLGGIAELLEYAEGHNHSDPAKWAEVRRLVGLCFLFKRSLYEQIGPLDEGFSPGHYEDDDYCYRAVQRGFRLLICGDTFIYHQGSVSFRQEHPQGWKELIERNRRRFIEKWGCEPASAD
ncbi:glycosyltransferase family 2 protein [Paenibacillus pinistramenti]|uniref:glycosyltransferase family 2 protein n=1 Tax=Paenibacillus pinistramenti TaxID=1768003 RepID=UPI001108ADF8|nr:glycosyltransferase family 2 protein [Paenibacillus pinistramenti]